MTKKSVENIIKFENEITSWDRPSDNFKNTKFKGTNTKWQEMCLAGEDAPIDQRTGKSACLGNNQSYTSPVTMFV